MIQLSENLKENNFSYLTVRFLYPFGEIILIDCLGFILFLVVRRRPAPILRKKQRVVCTFVKFFRHLGACPTRGWISGCAPSSSQVPSTILANKITTQFSFWRHTKRPSKRHTIPRVDCIAKHHFNCYNWNTSFWAINKVLITCPSD